MAPTGDMQLSYMRRRICDSLQVFVATFKLEISARIDKTSIVQIFHLGCLPELQTQGSSVKENKASNATTFSLNNILDLGSLFNRWQFDEKRKRRRDYYRGEYLISDAWKRKRFVVLRRDNWRCVRCGARAAQVHHTRYAKRNIVKEPIKWLVSMCKSAMMLSIKIMFRDTNQS